MKKSTRRRPELENLESVMLLSTTTHAAARHAAVATAEVAAPVTLNLTGSTEVSLTKSNVHLLENDAHGFAFKVSLKGQLATLGPVTMTEVDKIHPDGSFSATYTVSTGRGDLSLAGHPVGQPGSSATGTITTFDYTITGGTKAYARASGDGSIIDTTAINSAGHARESLSFVAQQLPPSTPYDDQSFFDL
jgi:hypothetical protein